VLLLSLLLSTSALAKKPDPTSVALTFGWKPGWTATYTEEASGSRAGVAQPTMTSTATLTVEAAAGGDLRLVWSAYAPPKLDLPNPVLAEILASLADVPCPAELVHADGSYAGLADVAGLEGALGAIRTKVRDRAGALREDPAAAPLLAAVDAFVGQALSIDVIAAKSADAWGDAVGFWKGVNVEVGTTYELEGQAKNALGHEVAQRATYSVDGWVPCHDGRHAPRCIRLLHHLVPDADALRAEMVATIGPMLSAAGLGDDALASVTAVTDVTLIVEPKTLRPWSVERTRSTTVAIRGPDGAVHPTPTTEHSVRTWSWR
jgi:hypothetical protein